MVSTWSPEGDGLAADREQAIAHAEDQFDLLRDGMIGDYPAPRSRRETDLWDEDLLLLTANQSEGRHD